MNHMEIHSAVRRYVLSFPGHVDAPSSQEAIRRAWANSGIQCGVSDFETALYSAGYKPIPIRDFFRLKLPAPPIQSFPARRRV